MNHSPWARPLSPPPYRSVVGSSVKRTVSAENLHSLTRRGPGSPIRHDRQHFRDHRMQHGRQRQRPSDDMAMLDYNRNHKPNQGRGGGPRKGPYGVSPPPPPQKRGLSRENEPSSSTSANNNNKPSFDKGQKRSNSPDRKPVKAENNGKGQREKMTKDRETRDNKKEDDIDSSTADDFDIARNIPKERTGTGEGFETVVKFLRGFIFGLIFMLLLACVTTSLNSFLLLEGALMRSRTQRWNIQCQLLVITCFPQLFGLIQSCGKTLFGQHDWPNKKTLILIICLEIIHAFGLGILVFQVIPYFGSFFALGIINATCIVPGVLKIIFTTSQEKFLVGLLFRIFDVCAVCVQIAATVVPLIYMASDSDHFGRKGEAGMYWLLPVALVCISVKWWENFVNFNRCGIRLFNLKKYFHHFRTVGSIFTNTVNIVVVCLTALLMEWLYQKPRNYEHFVNPPVPKYETLVDTIYDDADENTTSSNTSSEVTNPPIEIYEIRDCKGDCADDYFNSFVPGLGCILCAFLAYYIAGLACKLKMQRFSFALALILCMPISMGLIFMQCHDVIPSFTSGRIKYEYMCHGSDASNIIFPVFCWLSLVWLTKHILTPEIERLSARDRIFVTKMYTGPLIVQSMMMNRRNDQQDIKMGIVQSTSDSSSVSPYVNPASLKSPINETKAWEIKRNNRIVPKIYACGTMWHETKNEMMQLLKSVVRMDRDQNSRKLAEEYFKVIDPDYYEFETHIFFDDCMDIDEDDKWIPNQFVIQFVECIDEAASSVYKEARTVAPPVKNITPYGGKLVWKLPCGNILVVHLKDKHKIRHRKRWSQVMYMYYLLGYRVFVEPKDEVEQMLAENKEDNAQTQKDEKNDNPILKRIRRKKSNHIGKSDIFNEMTDDMLCEVENTFILALDGDVDFKPDAVRLLVDRMRVNPHTGAACGRIHPIGSGPLVWYQVFEYAIGHWFQKATEHILGCVLCSPGCFSLFRGSALLDDNVMKRYTTDPTEASHYVQYDQGEDRWLCTLLLQQGYRVDYSAASDALTYAPEDFNEFFNQRRRWTPSTIANIIDLLSDASNTIKLNPNISFFYMIYQFLLVVAMILGPSTIVLAIASAFRGVFQITVWQSYILSLAPVIFYLVICFKCKPNTQLTVASYLSAFYACVMTVVLVGILQTIVTQNVLNPSLMFLTVVSASFVMSAFIHPYEFTCILHGMLYYLCIPAGYLLLIIYSISNLHVVSWGTREVKKRKSKAQMEREKVLAEVQQQEKAKKSGLLSYLRLDVFLKDLKESLTQVFSSNKESNSQNRTEELLEKLIRETRRNGPRGRYADSDDDMERRLRAKRKGVPEAAPEKPVQEIPQDEEIEIPPDDADDPNFIKHPGLGSGPIKKLPEKEKVFFQRLIKKYLEPIKKDKNKEKALKEELMALRTKSSFGFWFANLLWVLFNLMISRDMDLNTIYVFGFETEPLGFVFLLFFMAVLLLQIVGMIMHRWVTFIQLISITQIKSPLREDITIKEAIEIVIETQNADPIFGDEEGNDDDDDVYTDINARHLVRNVRKELRHRNPRYDGKNYTMDMENPRRDENIGRAIDRRRRERQEERQKEPHYKENVRNKLRDRYGRLINDGGGDMRRRNGGGDGYDRDRYRERAARGPRGGNFEDVEARARRRLGRLGRQDLRY